MDAVTLSFFWPKCREPRSRNDSSTFGGDSFRKEAEQNARHFATPLNQALGGIGGRISAGRAERRFYAGERHVVPLVVTSRRDLFRPSSSHWIRINHRSAMDSKTARARKIQNEINDILFECWDPIGLKDVLPSDEYNGYVGKVYRALVNGNGELGIVRLLTDMENSHIGCRASYAAKQKTAKRLCALDIRLEGDGQR